MSDYDLTVLRFSFGITAVSQDGLKVRIFDFFFVLLLSAVIQKYLLINVLDC